MPAPMPVPTARKTTSVAVAGGALPRLAEDVARAVGVDDDPDGQARPQLAEERHLVAAPEVRGPGPPGRGVVDAGHDHAGGAHVDPGEARRAHGVGSGLDERVEAQRRAALVRRPLRAGQDGSVRVDDGEGRPSSPRGRWPGRRRSRPRVEQVPGIRRRAVAPVFVMVSGCCAAADRGVNGRPLPGIPRPEAALSWGIHVDMLILQDYQHWIGCPHRGAFDEPESTSRPRRRSSRRARP